MKNEIVCFEWEDAIEIAKRLINNEYVVMLSREEELTIINYEYAHCGDRSEIIFRSAEEFEMEQINQCDKCRKEREQEQKEE